MPVIYYLFQLHFCLRTLNTEGAVERLVLPPRLQTTVASLFGKTLRCYLPDTNNLRDFVSRPPPGNLRLHCTMIRHDDDLIGGSATYVLYLEYLGECEEFEGIIVTGDEM